MPSIYLHIKVILDLHFKQIPADMYYYLQIMLLYKVIGLKKVSGDWRLIQKGSTDWRLKKSLWRLAIDTKRFWRLAIEKKSLGIGG